VYCQNCGSLVDDTANVCPRCGQSTTVASPYAPPNQAGPGQFGPRVPTYLVQAILVTLFCCLPFGIVAIVYAAQVDGKQSAGDYEGAARSSFSARRWCWIGLWCGLVVFVLSFGFQIAVMSLGVHPQRMNFH
jgi:hypothetical protein